jgi:hypothetical protein
MTNPVPKARLDQPKIIRSCDAKRRLADGGHTLVGRRRWKVDHQTLPSGHLKRWTNSGIQLREQSGAGEADRDGGAANSHAAVVV